MALRQAEGTVCFRKGDMVSCVYVNDATSSELVDIGFVKSWEPIKKILFVVYPEQHGKDNTDRIYRVTRDGIQDTGIHRNVPLLRRNLKLGEILHVDCYGYKIDALVINKPCPSNGERYFIILATGDIEKYRSEQTMFINEAYNHLPSARYRLPGGKPEYLKGSGTPEFENVAFQLLEDLGINDPTNSPEDAAQFLALLHNDPSWLKQIKAEIKYELSEGLKNGGPTLFDGLAEIVRQVAEIADNHME